MVFAKKNEVTILLHGFSGAPESWRFVDTSPRVLAIELPGHDRQEEPPPYRSWDDAIAGIARSLSRLAPCAIAGYSMGARIALGLLIAHPSMFTRATLIGGSPGLPNDKERLVRRASDEAWALLIEERGVGAFADAWKAQPNLRIASQVPHDRMESMERVRREHSQAGLAWAMRTLGLGAMPDLFPRLGEIQQPVRLVAGSEDKKFCTLADRMLPQLKNGQVTIVPGSGHNVVLERPDEVRTFL